MTLALMGIVIYQIYYNIRCVAEMGGKYLSPLQIFYQVGTLIPPLGISLYQLRISFAISNGKDTSKLQKGEKFYVIVAWFYMLLAGIGAGLWIYSMIPLKRMQNSREEIDSFQKAVHFWVIYYLVMLYIPSWMISFNFICFVKQNKEKK